MRGFILSERMHKVEEANKIFVREMNCAEHLNHRMLLRPNTLHFSICTLCNMTIKVRRNLDISGDASRVKCPKDQTHKKACEGPPKEWIRLQGGYWGHNVEFTLKQWRDEVARNATRLGYWKWVWDRLASRRIKANICSLCGKENEEHKCLGKYVAVGQLHDELIVEEVKEAYIRRPRNKTRVQEWYDEKRRLEIEQANARGMRRHDE